MFYMQLEWDFGLQYKNQLNRKWEKETHKCKHKSQRKNFEN